MYEFKNMRKLFLFATNAAQIPVFSIKKCTFYSQKTTFLLRKYIPVKFKALLEYFY